jgi:hypothetical protein
VVYGAALATFACTVSGCTLPGDSVKGGLLAQGAEWSARVDANSGPSGENPSGTAWVRSGGSFGPNWEFTVTCLHVSGKTAIVGVTGTMGTAYGWGEQYPSAGLLRILDGGGAASRLDTFEFATNEGEQDGPPIPGPTSCSDHPGDFGPSRGPGVNQDGDLVVTDAEPLPTSQEQCANGGWRDYGFNEQGQCDAFVSQSKR